MRYDIITTCQTLAKTCGWDLPYTINADESVSFSIGRARFTGRIVGNEFRYSSPGGGTGIFSL